MVNANSAPPAVEGSMSDKPKKESKMVIVPREPTKAMLDAAGALPAIRLINAWCAEMQIVRGRQPNFNADDPPLAQAYRAMLSAAPQNTAAAQANSEGNLVRDRLSDHMTTTREDAPRETEGAEGRRVTVEPASLQPASAAVPDPAADSAREQLALALAAVRDAITIIDRSGFADQKYMHSEHAAIIEIARKEKR